MLVLAVQYFLTAELVSENSAPNVAGVAPILLVT